MIPKLNRILYIDDEQDILDVAKMCLETVGNFEVVCFSNAQTALEKVESIKPDLILLDVMMPKIDGPAALQLLRGKPALNNTPILFMTARIPSKGTEEYISLGANGVVVKPFDPMTLSSQISDFWNKFHESR